MNKIQRFLIIDDDPSVNLLGKMTIKAAVGITEIKAFTMAEMAVEYIDCEYNWLKEPVHTVILLDLNMPGMNGWQFLEVYDRFPHRIKKHFTIYILSSSVSESDQHRAYDHPLVEGYIIKPLTKDIVLRLATYSHADNLLNAS